METVSAQVASKLSIRRTKGEAHFFAPVDRSSPEAYRALKARVNTRDASGLSITIKSLSWRVSPDAEKFAAPVRSKRPSPAPR